MKKILETPRLFLRQFTMEDAPLLLQLNSDPEVLRYLHEPPLESLEHAHEILQNIILPQYEIGLGRWGMFLKDNDAFIGWCGLKFRKELDEIDLGYRLMKNYWGKGYGYEAALHTMNYAFETLNLSVITGRAHVDNIASLKILENLGMQFIRNEIVDDCPVKTYLAINPATRDS